jgi:hypothetical protein
MISPVLTQTYSIAAPKSTRFLRQKIVVISYDAGPIIRAAKKTIASIDWVH